MRILLIIFLLYGTGNLWAQGEGNVWVFGKNAGLDFNTGAPVPVAPVFSGHEGSASISDASGRLLFYTEGTLIYNRDYQVMPNGNLGIPYAWVGSQTQGVVIARVPGTENKYFLFINGRGQGAPKAIYCVVINMTLDNGWGDVELVTLANTGTNVTEKMAIAPGTDCNYWLVLKSNEGAMPFLAYEVTASGLSSNAISAPSGSRLSCNTGALAFSPDYRMMAAACPDGTELFDFDPATGHVSNARLIDTIRSAYGVCFAPGGKLLYVSANAAYYDLGAYTSVIDGVFQYDITRPDIPASRYYVGSDTGRGCAGYLKLGPDGRIYQPASCFSRNDSLIPMLANAGINTIRYPDSAGIACGYVPRSIALLPGTTTSIGLPNDIGIYTATDTVFSRKHIRACFTDSVRLTADTTGYGHTWEDGSRGTVRTIYREGTYAVRYRRYCTLYVDSFYAEPGNRLPRQLLLSGRCAGDGQDTLRLLPAPDDTAWLHYSWTDIAGTVIREDSGRQGSGIWPAGPGSYRVRIQNKQGCDTTLLFTIDPAENRWASFSADTFVCQQADVYFHNQSSGLDRDWRWSFGDGHTSADTSPVHRFTQPGIYTVLLSGSNGNGCTDTFRRIIEVDTIPFLNVSGLPEAVCAGDMFHATVMYRSSGFEALIWEPGDGTPVGSVSSLEYRYEHSGMYVVSLTATYRACPDIMITDTITVSPYPQTDLGPDITLCPGDASVRLYNLAPAVLGNTFFWSTGATSESIEAGWPGGQYVLQVTTAAGCATADTINILRSCDISIPNAFTPDGNGHNDFFLPHDWQARGIVQYNMQLFNRWGEQVYHARGLRGNGWDGTRQGIPQPQGVYIYLIEVMFRNGENISYTGNVTLIR